MLYFKAKRYNKIQEIVSLKEINNKIISNNNILH